MRVALATIVLNEAEMIPHQLTQHLDWPGLVYWVFVEGVCGHYLEANPDAVGGQISSVDNTPELILRAMTQDRQRRIRYTHVGTIDAPETIMGEQKSLLRNYYCRSLDEAELDIDLLIVIDADEFYSYDDQRRIVDWTASDEKHDSWRFRQRHIWAPPSVYTGSPDLSLEVVGGYWDVPHTRVFRWKRGSRYRTNHNFIDPPDGQFDIQKMQRGEREHYAIAPQCVHLGFAREPLSRKRTNAYYVQRGEGTSAGGQARSMYVDCRTAWETWTPRSTLPHSARVIKYDGPIPECFQ